MVTRPRSAGGALSFIFKFLLDRIYSFGDRAIFMFLAFWLEIVYSRPLLGGFMEIFSPNDVIYHCNPNMHFLVRKHVIRAIKRENRFNGSTGRRIEKKRTTQDSQKSHKGVIFHLFGEKPELNPFSSKFVQ